MSGQDEISQERIAGLHLRTGMLALARAELEASAGEGPLAGPALADLAEARWRTGDLEGAGLAAGAHLEGGGDSSVALVIAAEAAAAAGRSEDAAALVGRLADHGLPDLDATFAGLPRHADWPGAIPGSGPEAGEGPRLPDAAAALDAARLDLIDGRDADAAVRLALVLRTDPELAPAVLAAAERRSGPAFDVVRGDAYRIVGRESEAAEAYEAASAGIMRPIDPGPRSGRSRHR